MGARAAASVAASNCESAKLLAFSAASSCWLVTPSMPQTLSLLELALRAQVVFACSAPNVSNKHVDDLRITPSAVTKWISRFIDKHFDGLAD